MIAFPDFVAAFRELDLPRESPIIAHASLSAFGEVQGGAETILGAMIYVYDSFIMPGFTYRTMIVPESGPPNNGLSYGQSQDRNLMASFFRHDLPADRLMGVLAEALRRHPRTWRSKHPILSFLGINSRSILEKQTHEEPLKPIELLLEQEGWVLLMGVNHQVNTSIHYAEKLADRKQFLRWALTSSGVIECPGFPGCSDGFEAAAPYLSPVSRTVLLGKAKVQAIPLKNMIEIVRSQVQADPMALLCDQPYCERCEAVRQHVRSQADVSANPLSLSMQDDS